MDEYQVAEETVAETAVCSVCGGGLFRSSGGWMHTVTAAVNMPAGIGVHDAEPMTLAEFEASITVADATADVTIEEVDDEHGIMKLNTYQTFTDTTAQMGERQEQVGWLVYCALKLNGEAGEVAEKVGKYVRGDFELDDEHKRLLGLEIGDVLWYCSQLARALDFTLEEIAQGNIDKLTDRVRRGVLRGSGDQR
jgi:NTP pyrophosphatase (non-canonical NTP hydrolase)